jgi:ribonuclease HIII
MPCQMSLLLKPFSPRDVVQEIKNLTTKHPVLTLSQEKYSDSYQEKNAQNVILLYVCVKICYDYPQGGGWSPAGST